MSVSVSREVARRVFANEFNVATHAFKESEDERAPNYILLPTGIRANRVFIVGTLTQLELKIKKINTLDMLTNYQVFPIVYTLQYQEI